MKALLPTTCGKSLPYKPQRSSKRSYNAFSIGSLPDGADGHTHTNVDDNKDCITDGNPCGDYFGSMDGSCNMDCYEDCGQTMNDEIIFAKDDSYSF